MIASNRDFNGAVNEVLACDFGEIQIVRPVGSKNEILRYRLQLALLREELKGLAQVRHRQESRALPANARHRSIRGLCPKRDQSGETDKELRISKCGDGYLRRLLVSAAQYILGPFGADSALREHGLRLAQEGTAKARSGSSLSHESSPYCYSRSWKSREPYESFHTMA